MITIIVNHEDGQSDEFDFDSSQTNISVGRRSTNDVCIPNLSVSGRHARIVFNDGEAWIEDLNSTNGTYINNRLISRQMLNHNDELIIGKTRVRFVNPAAGATLDAESETIDKAFDNVDPFDDSGPQHPIGSTTPNAPRHTNTGASPGLDSPQAKFESLADDLAERRDSADAGNEESSMSLSEKAKLALGRSGARPTLAAVNGSAAMATETADGAASATAEAVSTEAEVRPASRPAQQPAKQGGAVIEIKNGAKSGQVLPIDKPVTTLGRPGIQIAAIMRKPDGYFLMHIESDDSVDRPTLNDDAIGDEPMLLQSGDELNVAGIDVEFNLG